MATRIGLVGMASVIAFMGGSASGQAAPVAFTLPPTGAGQPSAPPPSTPGAAALSEVSPPRLLSFVEATYPATALAAGRESRVVLILTIDSSGGVTAAEIAESGGEDFDREARRAALSFRFAPATRGGSPVAARILYRYVFQLPGSAPQPAPPAFDPSAQVPEAGSLPERAGTPAAETASSPSEGGAAPLPAAPDAAPQPALLVTVRGDSRARRLRASARAVKVIEIAPLRSRSADLGTVLAHTEGVGFQRSGGMGSESRLSLHGLSDDQVRVFLDGVPLESAGFGFGLASVPLTWIEHVEVYRGVVPIALGTDALGGAIQLVTELTPPTPMLSVAYTAGSFDTHQLALSARTRHEPSGFVARAAAFYDRSRNDYLIDVEVPDELGRLHPARVRRFQDEYAARGALVEAGFVERPWARRLVARVFATRFDKDLQHNLNMTAPYGEVTYGQTTTGGSLRYEQSSIAGAPLSTTLLFGYARRRLDFLDAAPYVYDWYGRRVFERGAGTGELSPFASDLSQWEHRGFARARLSLRIGSEQRLELSIAPEHTTRTGRERLRVRPERIDPLTTERSLTSLVSGLEHAFLDSGERIENNAFAKYYYYGISTDQVETFDNSIRHIADRTHRVGVGDGLRVSITPSLLCKGSYEYATRLPRPDEVFGDGARVTPNLELSPETSHNANLGALFEQPLGSSAGRLEADVTGFLRHTADMVVRLPRPDRVHSIHQNVLTVRTLGVDGSLRWTSPARWLTLAGNATYQDQRNAASEGPFALFEGQRLPNRPWLFANAAATFRIAALSAPGDALSLGWQVHYVRAFRPGWEGTTPADASDRIPTQVLHDANITYSIGGAWSVDASLDLQNLTDARAYDVLGVQKPGRAAYFKLTACWACATKT